MSRALTAHAAHITTAAVQINTLTVSGKQVTLAVFRQLREEPLIAEDGTLNGVPWGTVNYHPDRCADDPEHMHVVWQTGADLRRSSVCPTRWYGHTKAGAVVEALAAEGYRINHAHLFGPSDLKADCMLPGQNGSTYFRFGGITFFGSTRPAFREAIKGACESRSMGRNEALCRSLALEFGAYDSLPDLIERILPTARYHAQFKAVADLPQLFIAV